MPESKDPLIVGLVELFRAFLGMTADQVTLYNGNWKIPNDDRVYLSIAFLTSRAFGGSREYIEGRGPTGQDGLIEVLSVNHQETYTINVYGRTSETMQVKDVVAMAFNSTMAQQAMERLSFSLAKLPISTVDVSGNEGAARIFRYAVTVNLLRVRTRQNIVQYYDTFQTPALVINP